MAMQVGGSSGRGQYGRIQPMAEINVTPMVDVMLVLLIIFMITAPLLTTGVMVEMPETEAEAVTDQGEPLVVSILEDGTIFIQDTEIEFDNLVPRLTAMAAAGYDQPIYLQGDKKTIYDNVAKVSARINRAGFRNIVMVHE
ncbi:MAG: biopolymer transporter ExbD [Parvularculaceae bacterium]